MQEVIWDNTPSQRTRKGEKFTTPVITLSALDKPGAGRKFTFNKACQEVMGIQGEDRVSFGFTPDGEHIFLKKASGTAGFKLTKTCTLSDKKTYEYIAKILELITEVENNFDVVATAQEGVFEMLHIPEFTYYKTWNLGTVSEEPVLEADLSGIPETPVGGAIYEERVNIVDLADEDVEETAETADLSMHLEEGEEDAWN